MLLVLVLIHHGKRLGEKDIPRAWERKVLWLQAVCRIRRFCRRWFGKVYARVFRERFATSVPRELIGVWGEFSGAFGGNVVFEEGVPWRGTRRKVLSRWGSFVRLLD